MRVGTDLTTKAFMALEQALQRCRYREVRGDFALRFALAYLWSINRGDRRPFAEFWRQLGNGNDVLRFRYADQALSRIYGEVGVPRDREMTWAFWRLAQAEHEDTRAARRGD